MAEYGPILLSAIVQDIPSLDGFLLSPPIAWPTVAEQMRVESGTTIDGEHVEAKGAIHGTAVPKLQDTYKSGTGGRTGKAFTVVQGTVQDDWVSKNTSKYGLFVPASTGTFEVVAASTDARILPAHVVLRRGANAVNNSPTKATSYTYLELCYQNNTNYRIAMEWGKPLRLDYYTGGAWYAVEHSKLIYNIDAYLEQNSNQITLKILPDYHDNDLIIRVGTGIALKHTPPSGVLPAFGNIRLIGQNGWASFEYYPLRFQPLAVSKSQRNFGRQLPVGGGFVVANGRGYSDPAQTAVASITGDGQTIGHTTTLTLPDAGDTLGSIDPAKLVDATIVIPARWDDGAGGFGGTIFLPPVIQAELLETFDDATRTYSSSAVLPINNWNGFYTGSYGNMAVNLSIGTGVDALQHVFQGIGGAGERGIEFYQTPSIRGGMTLPCADYSYKMQVPLAQEVCFDGWCIFSAVRFLCECGNIHPRYLQTIPFYVPPGATANTPYGPAGADCPYFILAKGTGLNAKYKFLPDWTPWQVLQRIVQDAADVDPITGLNIPYFMGFIYNQFHFESYNPRNFFPSIYYSEIDPTGYAQIEEIHVYNSVAQMRTEISFQGIDAFTNELLYYYLPMPDSVLRAVGFRFPWLERDARFSSQSYMIAIANAAAVQASLPTQIVVVKVPFHPQIRAGMVMGVQSSQLPGFGMFYITEIRSVVGYQVGGQGTADCYSIVSGRRVENF
jgi:hypothetical protein